jgi:UDP-N-acetylglucosamine 2-epimerase
MFEIRKIIRDLKPDYVLFHGDTMNTAMAVGASAWVLNPFKKWRNIHLEAGLRSGSIFEPFPEEFTRQVVDKFSDILIAVSDLTEKNLERYKGKKIIKIGNTIADSSAIAYNKGKKKYKKPRYKYALINLHRHENLRNKERMKRIVNVLKNVQIRAIWPLHDNTAYHLKKYDLMKEIKKIKNIEIIPLTDYPKFIFLLANCEYVITDGGSIQEESLIFKKPCVLLRKKTERQEGLDTGINFLTKLDVNYAKKMIQNLEKKRLKIKKFRNPYGAKGVSKKIVEILR